uniref:Kunitz/Bovine pancreatic trypsin inhibitor domain protein n=1 Tax=Angiostrongylus cantonensis TaxID=6313 RepID=A0A0K0DGN0_ANGCA
RACQLACQPLDNPCIGQPATTAAGQVLFCSSTNKDACPVNFWCHIGATPETTVCCPGATNACSVPLAPGTGNAGLSRWYYNPDDRQCLPFQYNGKRGNQNNFETQAECERTCPVIMNPCLGKVHRDENGTATGCNPMTFDQCPNGFFCLAGDPAASNTSYCCPRMSQKYWSISMGIQMMHVDICKHKNCFVENICDSSWSEGEGDDSLDRFYYDSVEGECYPFTYKGRRGNENNFLTKRICEETCKPSTIVCFGGESPLLSPSGRIVQCHSEPCPGAHYCHQGKDNKSTVCCMKKVEDDCLAFNYTGLGGNENNFVNRAQCQIACPGYRGYCPHGKPHMLNGVMTKCAVDTKCPSNYICHISKRELKNTCCPDPAPNQNMFAEELCLLSIDRGACGGRQTRYAFNRQTSQCTPFDYTGCGGNLNNFVSMMDCMATCGNVGFRR